MFNYVTFTLTKVAPCSHCHPTSHSVRWWPLMLTFFTKLDGENSCISAMVHELLTLSTLSTIPLPILHMPKMHGAPFHLHSSLWNNAAFNATVPCGPQHSCLNHLDFLEEEFANMIAKGQWTVIPASITDATPNIHLSSPGIILQCNQKL